MNSNFQRVLVVIVILSTVSPLTAQVRSKTQLAEFIVNEFQSYARGQQRAVVREFRVPESVDLELTEAVKQQLQNKGIIPALSADYEIEGRYKSKRASSGLTHYNFELKIVNPNGYDHIREYSVPSQWITAGRDTTQPEIDSQIQPEIDIDLGREHGEGRVHPSVGHQVYPSQEWKHYRLPSSIMQYCSNGFISDEYSWRRFWAESGSLSPLPHVDFRDQMVRVETAPYPRTVSASLFSAGEGRLDVRKSVSSEPIDPGQSLNVHILVFRKSDLGEKRKIRFGVTVDATEYGQGVVITSTVPDAPVTRGRLDDGRRVELEPGDVIYSLNGIRTDSVGTFAEIIKNCDGNLRAEIRNVRDGSSIYVNFLLN